MLDMAEIFTFRLTIESEFERKPSKMATNSPPDGGTAHAPTHYALPPAYTSGAHYRNAPCTKVPYQNITTTAAPPEGTSCSQQDAMQSQAKVQSYDSFKKIIEGHTYHPEDYSSSASHSHESSAASMRSDQHIAVHSRTSSGGTIHSPGRTSTHSIEDFETAKRNSSRLGYVNEIELRAVEVGYGAHGSRVHANEPNVELTVKHKKGATPTAVPYRTAHAQHHNMAFNAAQRLSALPDVHRGSDTANHVQRRTDFGARHPRAEPDGEDNSYPPPSQDSTRHDIALRHAGIHFDAVDASPTRRNHKLRRQVGVHVTDDVSPARPPRPQTEYLDRSGVYEDHPVVMRNNDGKPRRGYINSAYIEDSSPPLETISETNIPSSVPVKTHHLNRLPTHHHQYIHQGPSARNPSQSANVMNRHQAETNFVARVRVANETATSQQPMKRTVREAIKERDDQVMLRRQYVQQKHQSHNIDHLHNVNPSVRAAFQQQRQSLQPHFNPYATNPVSQQQQMYAKRDSRASAESQNHLVHKSRTSAQQPLKRPLSISPDRKQQGRFTGDPRIPARPQAVGLQKFTRDDSAAKGAAIMVHMVPSGDQDRNQAGKTSPVVIQVGAMTLERLKHKISKKNKYVVQQKMEKVKQPSKPRTHFTLSLFTMCFCLSPLGFVAMIFAVCSASAYKEKDAGMGRCLSKAALALSILGIVTSIAVVAILIGTNTIPVIGRYSEPEGN